MKTHFQNILYHDTTDYLKSDVTCTFSYIVCIVLFNAKCLVDCLAVSLLASHSIEAEL